MSGWRLPPMSTCSNSWLRNGSSCTVQLPLSQCMASGGKPRMRAKISHKLQSSQFLAAIARFITTTHARKGVIKQSGYDVKRLQFTELDEKCKVLEQAFLVIDRRNLDFE